MSICRSLSPCSVVGDEDSSLAVPTDGISAWYAIVNEELTRGTLYSEASSPKNFDVPQAQSPLGTVRESLTLASKLTCLHRSLSSVERSTRAHDGSIWCVWLLEGRGYGCLFPSEKLTTARSPISLVSGTGRSASPRRSSEEFGRRQSASPCSARGERVWKREREVGYIQCALPSSLSTKRRPITRESAAMSRFARRVRHFHRRLSLLALPVRTSG